MTYHLLSSRSTFILQESGAERPISSVQIPVIFRVILNFLEGHK